MGDIYHAGEVYAGSVPIDDTQASEDTVYSSAKVETMMEGIQEQFDNLPISAVEAGNKNCNVGTTSPTTNVLFNNTHTSPPDVILCNSGNPQVRAGATNRSSTGFDIAGYYTSSTTAYVQWLAVWL